MPNQSNNINWISISSVIYDYIKKTDHKEHVDEELIHILANEAINDIVTVDNYKEHIILLNLFHQKAKLPANFKYPTQVAYRPPFVKEKINSESIKRYFINSIHNGVYETDIVGLNANCVTCKQEKCSCKTKEWYPIEIDQDYVKLSKTPVIASGYSKFMYGVQNSQINDKRHFLSELSHFKPHVQDTKGSFRPPILPCFDRSTKCPQFQIVRPSSNTFFNLPNSLKGCNLPMYDTNLEYRVSEGFIYLNNYDYKCDMCNGCKKDDHCYMNYPMESHGEVLISYLGKRMDDKGFLLIPDESYVIKAVIDYVIAGLAQKDFSIERTQAAGNYFQTMRQIADISVTRARTRFRIPHPDDWEHSMSNHFNKITPYFDSYENMNRYDNNKEYHLSSYPQSHQEYDTFNKIHLINRFKHHNS